MSNTTDKQPFNAATFLKTRGRYLMFFGAVILLIIASQISIQQHLNSQLNVLSEIHNANSHQAYGQALTTNIKLLKANNSNWQDLKLEIEDNFLLWKRSYQPLDSIGNLSAGSRPNNASLLELIDKTSPYHSVMSEAIERITKQKAEHSIPITTIEGDINVFLQNQSAYVVLIDQIISAYNEAFTTKLKLLKLTSSLFIGVLLFMLLLELIFVMKPLSQKINTTIATLEAESTKMESIEALLQEKEKSLQELQELNFVIDNAALFASAKSDGKIVFISKKFLNLLNLNSQDLNKPLSEVLTTDEGQQQYLKEILKRNRKTIRTEEIKIKTTTGAALWLDMSIIPMQQSNLQQSMFILCSDITERQHNQLKVEELSRHNYEESIRQKQLLASQIVEGQEEERKRIAKDIHDGIGQMLTALKFNIESINLNNPERTKEKIEYLKALSADLIKGVRTATFNLTPPELSDHGIFPAFQKMATELTKLTGEQILFENKTGENIRFSSFVETNIYRVAQEAVNNAIKYAQANYILLTINYTDDILSVVIDDDGKGFDDSILNELPSNNSEGGMGLFFMKERINFINGRLFINSTIGKGTRVTINYKTEKDS